MLLNGRLYISFNIFLLNVPANSEATKKYMRNNNLYETDSVLDDNIIIVSASYSSINDEQ